MPLKFNYFADSNCLFVIGTGRVSLQEFLEYHGSAKIPNPQPNLLILADYRGIDPSDLTASDIEQIRDSALSKVEGKFETVKEATVVADTLAYGLTRMFDGVVYSEKYELNIFTDLDEAKRWLGLAPETSLDKDRGMSPSVEIPYSRVSP